MTDIALLAAKAALVLSTALSSGDLPAPDPHRASWATTNAPVVHVVAAPKTDREALDGALD